MGYDRNDCWMTCGERDDKCSAMGLMKGPFTLDPFDEIERLRAALIELLDKHCELVNSGDCGNWDAETEPHVIKARAALAHR